MKLIKRFFLVTAALSGIVFAGCNKSDTVDNVALTVAPTSKTVAPGTLVVFTFSASSNVTLTKLDAVETINGQGSTPYDTTFSGSNSSLPSFTWSIQVPALAHNGDVEVYTFTLTDKNGQTATATSTITVAAAGGVNTFGPITLGDQDATPGRAFETSTGTALNYSSDSTNSKNIDFVLVSDASYNLWLAAPSDADALLLNSRVANWPVRNATQFKVGVQGTFASFTNSLAIDSAYNTATGTAATNVNVTAGGNLLVAFKTAAGKNGVAEVSSIVAPTSSTGGTATINIVVEK